MHSKDAITSALHPMICKQVTSSRFSSLSTLKMQHRTILQSRRWLCRVEPPGIASKAYIMCVQPILRVSPFWALIHNQLIVLVLSPPVHYQTFQALIHNQFIVLVLSPPVHYQTFQALKTPSLDCLKSHNHRSVC